MGWFGIGARVGVTQLRLTAPTSVVNSIEQLTGGTAGADEFALRSNVTTVTPTLHLGGTGFFFKLDLPISFGSSFTMPCPDVLALGRITTASLGVPTVDVLDAVAVLVVVPMRAEVPRTPLPAGPVAPVAPVEPVAPVGPVGPAGPVGPLCGFPQT